MSFVLEYLTVGGVAPDLERLEDWRRGIPEFLDPVEQEGARVWMYRNPASGVYFSVSFRPAPERDDDLWAPSGLEATLNHLRPGYFAREASPLLCDLASELELLPRDGDTGRVLSVDPDPETMRSLWRDGNRHLLEEARDQGRRLHAVPEATNLAWWEYSRRRPRIEEQLRREDRALAVPEVHHLHDRSGDRVVTAFSWECGKGSVLPQADIVVVDRTTTSLFGLRKKRELAWVPYDVLVRQVVGALRTVEVDGLALRVLSSDNAWRAAERIPSLDLVPELEVFQSVPAARVVDAQG